MHEFPIGSFVLSDARPPMFLAEIGALFGQDMALAERLIETVAKARDQAPDLPLLLKGEILQNADFCLDDDSVETYQSRHGVRRQERYRELIERKVLPLDSYRAILDRARSLGLEVVMSIYDEEGADFAVENGVVALKIASSNVNHLPLIRHVAGLGVPMLIDTGRATLGEVETAVRTARQGGARVLIQHSPDGHPAPPENHNLKTLTILRQVFEAPVGLSCHSASDDMLFMAIALGAAMVEKNVLFDTDAVEQDVAISTDITRLPSLLERLLAAWQAMGRPFRDPANRHGLIATSGRMGLVCQRDLAPGDRVDRTTIRFAFPCKGIPVHRYDEVAGWVIRRPVAAGKPIGWCDVEPGPS